jgi:hypothetical protein
MNPSDGHREDENKSRHVQAFYQATLERGAEKGWL